MNYIGINNYPWERATVTYPFIRWSNVFSGEELDRIEAYFGSGELERAKTLGSTDVAETEKIRRCDLKFHQKNDENKWIFERFNQAIWEMNAMFYGFDLNGYEHIQYTTYRAEELGKYGWHMDMCLGREALPPEMTQPRKLSLSMQLNDPSGFDGGEFQVHEGDHEKATTVALGRGEIVAFPSYLPHQVLPVTRGVRKSLVIWVVGPKFR